jgi:hypothetical protein
MMFLNVLVLAGSRFDRINKLFSDYWDCDDVFNWDPNDKYSYMGPECKLCKKTIFTEGINIVHNNISYWIYFDYSHINVNENSCCDYGIWKSSRNQDYFGMLQCSYCFGFFHRNKCSLSLSHKSYYQALKSRTWACPICVPIFVPEVLKQIELQIPLYDFLMKLFSLLSKVFISPWYVVLRGLIKS